MYLDSTLRVCLDLLSVLVSKKEQNGVSKECCVACLFVCLMYLWLRFMNIIYPFDIEQMRLLAAQLLLSQTCVRVVHSHTDFYAKCTTNEQFIVIIVVFHSLHFRYVVVLLVAAEMRFRYKRLQKAAAFLKFTLVSNIAKRQIYRKLSQN